MRHNKLKALNYKLSALLPKIQEIRKEMQEAYEYLLWNKALYSIHNSWSIRAEKEFLKLLKKLSIYLTKYAKINAQRKQYRIFVKCTQFSLFN